MPDSHSPDTPTGSARLELSRPDFLDEDACDVLADALTDALDARLHLAAMLEILRSVHPAYKIEAGLYLGNLQNIYARVARVVDAITVVQMPA